MSSSATDAPGRRLAVVSGAASGIGLATARALAERGTGVVGVDLDDAPSALAAHGGVSWIRGDVADDDTWARVLSDCLERDARGADCFVACAGTIESAPLLDLPLEQWRRLYEINVLGVVRGLQALMPAMRAQGTGWVAIVASVAGQIVEDGASAYCASKAALLQVARSAALEYAADGLRVNAVCPGIVDTPLLRRFVNMVDDPPALVREMEQRTPTGLLLAPEEVADVLCFLVSDGASGLSGATLTIDGGLTTTYDFDVAQRAAAHAG
jgi:NAD(P)-dependent dehydrogenase (short-subunit alcohol dehydrogenase family)